MNISKKIAATVLSTAVLGTGVVAASTTDANASTGCVTRAGWSHIYKGMTRARVASITGAWGSTYGHQYYPGTGNSFTTVTYRKCDGGLARVAQYRNFNLYQNWGRETLQYKQTW